jgi:hypothetical protein
MRRILRSAASQHRRCGECPSDFDNRRMATAIQDMSTWGPLGSPQDQAASSLEAGDGLATPGARPTAQHGQHASAALAAGSVDAAWTTAAHDIGQRVSETRWDLQVVCDAAEAMRLQFDIVQRAHIAVHDVGGTTSRRLLAGMAAATQTKVRTLTIRRQGYGHLLATLEYVELPAKDVRPRGHASSTLCIFSTEAKDTDSKTAQALVDVILGRSRLGVVMMAEDATGPAVTMALANIKDTSLRPAWRNRNLLLMPLRDIPKLGNHAIQLGLTKHLDVRIAPTVLRPVEAWTHLRSTWNQLTRDAAEEGDTQLMQLADPTARSVDTAGERLAARIAERVANGKATAEELRRFLEGNDLPSATTMDAPAVLTAPTARVGVDRPATVDGVHRAPSWTAAQAVASPARTNEPAVPSAPLAAPPSASPSHVAQAVSQDASAQPSWPTLPSLTPSAKAISNAMEARMPPPTIADTLRPMDTPVEAAVPARTSLANAVGAINTPAVEDFLTQCAQIKGMQACWVADISTRNMVASRSAANTQACASDSTRLANALRTIAMAFQLPGRVPETSLTYDQHHLVMRPLAFDERLVFVGVVDKAMANTTVVHLRLQHLAAALAGSLGIKA